MSEGEQMETKWTPGPWAIHHDGKPLFGHWHIRQDPKDWRGQGYQAICTLPADKKGTRYGDMFAANARLISAAPDLAEALRAIISEIEGDDGDKVGSSYQVTKARAVLAKIEDQS